MSDKAHNVLPIEDSITRKVEDRARWELEIKSRALAETFQHSPLGIVWLNKDLNITSSNQSFMLLYGTTCEKLIGRGLWDCLPDLPRQPVLKAIFEKSTYRLEHYLVASENHELQRHFDIAIWPMTDTHGNVSGALLSLSDQTSRMRALQEREDLMFTLAHDLKVPHIGADRMFELLLENTFGDLTADQKRVVSMMRQSNQDVLSMLHNLLYLYRTEHDVDGFSPLPFDLSRLIRKCVMEMAPLSDAKVLKITVELPPNLPACQADANAIRRVLTNLLHNAIKFTPDGGTIKISGGQARKNIFFTVADNGSGIAKEDHGKLFKRFWQGNSKRHTPGNGLGLYVCRKIIEAHHGTITVKSQPNEGTVFTVKLPK